MRDGVLVRAVVVHRPDLFGAVAGEVDVVDLRLGDALDTTAQPEDDVVGELVRDLTRAVHIGGVGVLLRKDLGELLVVGVVEEAAGSCLAAAHAQRSEGDHARAGGRRSPLREIDLGGSAGRALRLHALRDHVEDAGVGQVRLQGRVEGVDQLGRCLRP